ncbi:hypothetical protein G8V07_11535 [Clostridium botulinum D/C]|uniref:hypothetical protein n=1 Tax=Clostridium botulinum TaxID=1491 RepID=UPI001E5C7981|nr:hypothetical protein [Clostridium botulinum]MCD3319515.1 hypothetical protein [Clostridium botulinum D/C]MCD3324380.1 hypothetical protein [Clostridium botulinum D/C]MCD3327828.1 hypothetical protein [Clostridium botulinum D/C]
MLKIYRTVQEAVKGNHDSLKGLFCYIKESNVRIQTFRDCMKITYLSNALKRGKTCTQIVITYEESTLDEIAYDLQEKYLSQNNRTLEDLLNELELLEIEDLQNAGFKVSIRDIKSIDTFSPFADIKPIDLPKNNKWTKSHVVKAILSGQIYNGVVDSIYTDDYARDADSNYHEGEFLDLMEMAETLVEHGSGWNVRFKEDNNGNISLDVNCHTFDLNTLYFNVDSRRDNLHYTEVVTASDNSTRGINTITTTTDINSKVASIFTYKQQKQENRQQLFDDLFSCSSLDQFKNVLSNYLISTKQNYIVTNKDQSKRIMDKLKILSKDDI